MCDCQRENGGGGDSRAVHCECAAAVKHAVIPQTYTQRDFSIMLKGMLTSKMCLEKIPMPIISFNLCMF